MSDPSAHVALTLVANDYRYAAPDCRDEVAARIDGHPLEKTTHPEINCDPAELLRRLVIDHLLRRTGTGGRCKIAVRATAASVAILAEMISPSGRSLRSYAAELGCSAAILSRTAQRLARDLHLPQRWQRPERAKADAARQRAVAAGVHVPTPKWERRKLTLAQQRQKLPGKNCRGKILPGKSCRATFNGSSLDC